MRINDRARITRILFFWAAAVLALPPLGLLAAGVPLGHYLEFPPVSLYVRHEPFSWEAFALLGAGTLLLLPLYFRGLAGFSGAVSPRAKPAKVVGAALLLVLAWSAAWSRLAVLAPLQHHTFVFVWLAYIYLVHVILSGAGRSPFTGRAGQTALLFVASACFWWIFEWLNRFVQNWTYHEVEQFGPFEYWLFATLSFSTVLPAALATKILLETRLSLRISGRWRGHPLHGNARLQPGAALFALVTLLLLGIFPNALFPCLWLSPLLLLVVLCRRFGLETFAALNDESDFADFVLWSLAGLCCGVLWETWNYYSLAGWDYQIPFVSRFRIFAMPLLGYAGYLPFGVLCGLVCEVLAGGNVRKK